MKRLLLILILTLSFQSWVKADDIRDFEIEGMSIGDSALYFFSEEKIKKNKQSGQYPNDEYILYNFSSTMNMVTYDLFTMSIKKNDMKYIISAISGGVKYDNLDNCLKLKKDFNEDVASLFNNISKNENKYKSARDKSGNSEMHQTIYNFESGDVITASCMDWSNETSIPKVFQTSIRSISYTDFIRNRAYR